MPRKQKINLEKVMASLFISCTQCGHKIQPGEGQRISTDLMRCPKCGDDFIPGRERGLSNRNQP